MAEIVSTNQFKNGMHIEVEGSTWRIVEFQHVKPGKGGAFVRTKLKSTDSGSVVDKTFRAGEKFARVRTDLKNVQYLYDAGDHVVFMDEQNYEQIQLPRELVADALEFVAPSSTVQLLTIGDRPSGLQMPASVELDKTGHPRDGGDRPGAALRQPGRQDQDRPARAPVHLARLARGRVVHELRRRVVVVPCTL